MISDDGLGGVNPHCPMDGVVMREVPGGWKCPECDRHVIPSVRFTGHPGAGDGIVELPMSAPRM